MVEQPGFSPQDYEVIEKIAGSARGLKRDYETVPFSIARAMLEEGHTRLREASSYNRGGGSVLTAPEPNSFFNSLAPNIQKRALEGLGFVLIGSLACAVEFAKSKVRGVWDDAETVKILLQNSRRLPIIVRAHHLQYGVEIQTTFLRKAALIFAQASSKPFHEPPNPPDEPPILPPEKRAGFLAEIDRTTDRITDVKKHPFAKAIDSFLEEMSGKLDEKI